MIKFDRTTRRIIFMTLALAVILLAAALRLHLLGAQSLWNDEGNAYVQSTRTFGDIASNAARDIHPPGYYWLLAVWRVLTGSSEFALRTLSAFAGILTVAFTYALGRRLYSRLAGLTAAALVTLNTFNLYYSQEARMYALLGLWSIIAMWALVMVIRTGRWQWALTLALTNAVGLYTHYAYPAVMIVQGVLFLIWIGAEVYQRYYPPIPALSPADTTTSQPSNLSSLSLLLNYVLANVLTILLFLPWLPTALKQVTTWPSTGQSISFAEALTVIVGWFSLGVTYNLTQTSIAFSFFLLFGLLVFPEQDGKRSWWRMLVPVLWVGITLG
ncbi:MAG TPA: glycosyltransferase family 39 protein, partial [Phototrophicaceae bacterium]|nr:glycosyltransferase family 39 protein [Phototrophicaceae bacterium]